MLELACAMESLPADYFRYYYYKEEVLAELRRLREALGRLEAQQTAPARPSGGKVVSMTTGAWRRLESASLLDDREAEAA